LIYKDILFISRHLLQHVLTASAVAGLLWSAASAYAADKPVEPPVDLRGSEIQFFLENDSFGSSDQYYTNGIKIGGGVPADKVIGLFSRPPNALLDFISDGGSNHFGLFIGQNIYTPKDITIAAPQPNDRPWAAWAYVGAVAQSVKDDRLHTVEFDLGFVGPPALGKPVQTFWHDHVVNSPEPQGWDNQIRTEPGLMLTYVHKRRYGPSSGVQVVPHVGASVGNIMTLVRAGGIVRFGQNMTGFGPDGIEPGGAMLKNARRLEDEGRWKSWEWFAFAGVDGRIVPYNIFLDGSLFRDGPSIARNDKVYDVTAGLSARIDKVRLSVTRVKRSEEFDGSGKQKFYSINLGIEF
jgi:lipid A 3-O-deacylase